MKGEERVSARMLPVMEAGLAGGGHEIEIAFEEPPRPVLTRKPQRMAEPDRAPESILTAMPLSSACPNVFLRPVDLDALRSATRRVDATRHPSTPRARRNGWVRAVYVVTVCCAVSGTFLVVGGVWLARARAQMQRLGERPAAIAGKSTLAAHVGMGLPPAPAKAAGSPVEMSSGAGGEPRAGSNAANPLAPVPLATTAAPASTGTLVLRRPARPGSVWLDGVKITTAATTVACGTHEIRVKGWHKHSLRVPCSGEVRVAR
jgi:hypothetical protein